MLKSAGHSTKTKTIAHIEDGEVLLVTPEIAKAWLDQNINNRRLQKRMVETFARDMKEGNWGLTYDPIRFDKDGILIDGQHRLAACIQADTPFETLVIYRMENKLKDLIDTGKSRAMRDILTMRGLANTSHVATALRILLSEKAGQTSAGKGFSHSETLEALEKHPSLPLWVPANSTMPRGISVGASGYLFYVGAVLLNRKDDVLDMMAVLRDGIPKYDGDPMHKYRERILRNSTDGSMRSNSTRNGFWTYKRAFNAFLAKESLDRIHWQKEDVPIEGLDLRKL